MKFNCGGNRTELGTCTYVALTSLDPPEIQTQNNTRDAVSLVFSYWQVPLAAALHEDHKPLEETYPAVFKMILKQKLL